MLTLDQIRSARWAEIYLFLTNGNPPLILVLLGLNTIFLLLFMVRRATKRHTMRASTIYFVQGVMIATNAFVLFREDIIRSVMMLKGVL